MMTATIAFSLWLGSAPAWSFPRAGLQSDRDVPVGVALLRREAKALEPLVESRLALGFLNATADLPPIAPRAVFLDKAKRTYLTEAEALSLSDVARKQLDRMPVDETLYYTTKYGSPLAYARPIDLLGRASFDSVAGRKILDFGHGSIGQLRLLAALGADVTGVDVDPLLRAIYSGAGDQGIVKNGRGHDGRLRLVTGRFPADEAVRNAVGGGYDVIISKNTLKRGYVHPERPVDERRLLNLGVDDARFVKTLFDALKPGGRVMIYNISPAPSPPGQPYKNWADGRCPFSQNLWESTGFRVIEFDHDDSAPMRTIAHALGWDHGESPIELNTDLFAQYSLFEKPLNN
jgi:SAM-dependent methyltransferase